MRRIVAQAKKELTQVVRDRLALVLALVLPMILLVLLGKALSLSVTDLPLLVIDMDRTPMSRHYVDAFRSSLTFRVEESPVYVDPADVLERGDARAVLLVPQNFERDLRRGRTATAQIIIDAADANTANIMRGSATAVTQAFGLDIVPAVTAQPVIRARTRLWYNPGRDTNQYIGPGVFAVILALFPPLLAALAMSREGEQKTILQVYVSSISAGEFLLGKILAYFVIALAQWVLALLVSFYFYELDFVGDPTPLLVGTVLYLFCNVCFGTMIGVAIPNQAAAIQAVQLGGFLLSFLMSGFIFPVANIPVAIRWIASLVPARYYIEISRDAFVRGGGWPAVWNAPLMLTLLGAVFFFVAWKRMRRMQVSD